MVEMFRRTGLFVTALALAAGLAPVATASAAPVGASASASAPYCGITWGSQPKTVSGAGTTESGLTNIRAGRHDCFDRLVFDFHRGNARSYYVNYVATMHYAAGDWVIPLRGGAKLSIMLSASQRPRTGGTYRCTNCTDLVNVSSYKTFRQVAWAGSYRNTPSIGLGLRARLPFRVFKLSNRLVIDVAHHW